MYTLSLTPGQTESEPGGQRPAKAPAKAESPLRASVDATGEWHRIVTFKPQFSSHSCSFLFGAVCFSLFLATLHGLGIYFPASSAGLLLGFFAAIEMLQLPSSTCMYDLSRWTVSGVPTLRRRQLCLRGVRGRGPKDTGQQPLREGPEKMGEIEKGFPAKRRVSAKIRENDHNSFCISKAGSMIRGPNAKAWL